MLADAAAYGGLFLSALVAATILPMQSEAVLVGLVLAGQQPVGRARRAGGAGEVLGGVGDQARLPLPRWRRKVQLCAGGGPVRIQKNRINMLLVKILGKFLRGMSR